MVLLLRNKLGVGPVMFVASAGLVLLYLVPPEEIGATALATLRNPVTVKLLLALSLIRIFEIVLREQKVLAAMMETVKSTFRSRRAIIVSMPLFIGMLPSLGGAYFSAPMVKEATAGMGMKSEEKAFINYWFRHPWEYVLPLYPGILLAAGVTGLPLSGLIQANLPCAIAILITGFLFSMRRLPQKEGDAVKADVQTIPSSAWLSFIPIAGVLLLVVLWHVELHYALLAATVPLVLYYRYRPREIVRILKHGFALEVIVLISGTMFFKEMMEASGAVANLSSFFVSRQIPILPIICLLPFVSGILTGLTVGFVGSTFPLLIIIAGGAGLPQMALAFAAGFIGVLLSPVHLCLVLTREYFKADLWGVYQKIIPAGALIFGVALAEYALLVLL